MPFRLALLVFLPGLLAACSNSSNLVRDAVTAAGVTGGEPRPAPDFVTRTRPGNLDYVPVGVDAPRRTDRAKSKEAVAEAAAALDATRSRNEVRGAEARRAATSPAATPPVAQ
ncbi:MAG: hypothetical protein JO048_12680 [Methylobacteriaceae bacterium]|nr:hypothetical protein [Methylobacteriaceae bacterium]